MSEKRKSKNEQYKKEQEQIFEEIYTKLNAIKDANGIILYDIIHNEEIINTLKNLIPKIRCYYSAGTWTYFIKNDLTDIKMDEKNIKNLIKTLFKHHNYDVLLNARTAERDGIKKQYICLNFFKK